MFGFRANGESKGKNRGWADLSLDDELAPEDRLSVLLFEPPPAPLLPGTNTYLTAAQ